MTDEQKKAVEECIKSLNENEGEEIGHMKADDELLNLIKILLDGDERVSHAFYSIYKWYA
jgi:hypothetical protein